MRLSSFQVQQIGNAVSIQVAAECPLYHLSSYVYVYVFIIERVAVEPLDRLTG